MNINILTNNTSENSKAFNLPLLVCRSRLRDSGCKLRFHWSVSDRALRDDILFVNSNVFRTWWPTRKPAIFEFLEKAKRRGVKIYWFDTTDSTWCTQFEVLPFVHKFLKGQVFSDLSLYKKTFRTGRIFTDFFDELYDAGEKDYRYSLPDDEHIHKIGVSWNTCFENYTRERYSRFTSLKHRVRPFIAPYYQEKLSVPFHPASSKRPRPLSYRVGLTHSRPAVVEHRKGLLHSLQRWGIDGSKIPLPSYFSELQNSRIGVGPFGVGEITLRDFEIIVCGALLLKPDLSHMRTWPNLFVPEKTYIAHRWDLQGLEDAILSLLDTPDRCEEISVGAQDVYAHALSDSGMDEFSNRLIKVLAA